MKEENLPEKEQETLKEEEESPKRFLKSVTLKMLWIFLVPAFSLWFFHHAVSAYDRDLMRSMSNGGMTGDSPFTQYLRHRPVSQILAGNAPEEEGYRRLFDKVRGDYDFFAMAQTVALVCLVLALAALVAGGLAAVLSRRSPAWQFWSLSSGWWVLRIVAVVEVIGQGALAVALSYWVTALWLDAYSIKLVVLIGITALIGVWLILKAIFSNTKHVPAVDGKLLPKDRSPALWAHIRQMAGGFSNAEPDNIILGVDNNFFVTEQPLKLGEKVITGRTLYLSLSLLKIMRKNEADAVLAHEMAHFSGKDTFHSRRIAPMLNRHEQYLGALASGFITLPVFHFMHFFWLLFQLSLSKISRDREFLADRLAVEKTSPQSLGRSLVKVASYGKYRGKVEQELFEQRQKHAELNLARSLEEGYAMFALQETDAAALSKTRTPHPFDSHPPLESRLRAVGVTPSAEFFEETLKEEVTDSWHDDIESAGEMENELWGEYEEDFRKQHEVMLPYRFLPSNEEEEKIVLEAFPDIHVTNKKGVSLTIRHSDISCSEWAGPIHYAAITTCQKQDAVGGYKMLDISHKEPGAKKASTVRLKLKGYPVKSEKLIEDFDLYFSRYKFAELYLKEQNAGATSADGQSQG